jgi:hypothetical protein
MPESRTFLRYHLRAETLCLGERIRGGVFRPCSLVFPYTSVSGALTSALGAVSPVHAVARFRRGDGESNRLETLTFAPHDRTRFISVISLQIEYLANVEAELFLAKTDHSARYPRKLGFSMGAMKSKGFGRCEIEFEEEVTCGNPARGRLCIRLPDAQNVKTLFGVRNVVMARYGTCLLEPMLRPEFTSRVFSKAPRSSLIQ